MCLVLLQPPEHGSRRLASSLLIFSTEITKSTKSNTSKRYEKNVSETHVFDGA